MLNAESREREALQTVSHPRGGLTERPPFLSCPTPLMSVTSNRGPDPAQPAALAGSAFDHAPLGLAVLDGAGIIRHTNAAFHRVFRRGPEALKGCALTALLPGHEPSSAATLLEALNQAENAVADLRLDAAPGAPRWIRVNLSREPSLDRNVALIVGTFEDVTAQKSDAETIRSSTHRLQQLVEQANDIIFNIDLHGRFTWVNPAASRLLKRPATELVGMSFVQLVRHDHRADAERFYQQQVRERIPSTYYEFPAVAADGTDVWLGQYVQLIAAGDWITNVQAVARDITARRHAEDLLRASEERVRVVVSTAPIILWSADRDGVFTLCEGHGLKGLDLTGGGAVGQRVADVYTDPDVAEHMRRALDGSAFQTEMTLGNLVFDSWCAPLRDQNRDVTGVIGVAVDVTERTRLSRRLREAEKLEAIGRLSGGVAHDFNNQLTAILGFAEMLQQSFAPDDPRNDDVVQILKSGRRAASLTEALLAFGRKQPRRPTVLDLNAIVADLAPLLLHTIREDVQLETDLDADLCAIRADEGQIEQVIMNLALNARDAMPGGGQLTIRTAGVTLDDDSVGGDPTRRAGAYASVAVTDTGEGIDAETMAHMFEPFYTTKEQGKGTGMGLASVYGMVQQSGGFIEVASTVGQGSTFTFYLPSAGGAAPRDATTRTASSPARGTETVLLVEDDAGVREMTAEALGAAGYCVVEAQGIEQAREAATSRSGGVDLLLTDVVLPDGSGPALAAQLLAAHPTLRALFMTAYAADPTLRDRQGRAYEVLEKPFGPEELLQRVRRFLDRAPEEPDAPVSPS